MKQFIALTIVLGLGACTNPDTPEGHEGYVFHRPLLFGKMEHRESQVGPASTGVSWRLYVTNIDMRVRNYAEKFELLTRDDLKLKFSVNTRISLKRGSVKRVVEEFGGENWYTWNVKAPLRTAVRRIVMRVRAEDLHHETSKVAGDIKAALKTRYKDTPVVIQSVDIDHLEFPPEVQDAIDKRVAKTEELKQQKFELQKARKEAAIRILKAIRIAKKQRIISSTLDPLYVQLRAVEVYRHLAESNNKTVMMLPNTTQGTGMPLVMTQGRRKVLSEREREQLDAELERISKKYADVASSATGQQGADDKEDEDLTEEEPKPTDPSPTPTPPSPTPQPTTPPTP